MPTPTQYVTYPISDVSIPGTVTVVQPVGTNLHAVIDSGTITATNPSVGSTGAAVPASATFVAVKDSSGNLTSPQLTAAGNLPVDGSSVTQPISVSSLPLPTGASTAANQTTANSSLSSIDGKIVAVNTGAVVVSSSALPSGAASSAKQPALGTAGAASADVLTVQGIAAMTALKVDGSAVTQPVSGTVTANAGTGNFTVVQATGTNLHTVVDSGTIAATQSGTWNITNVSGTVSLPTGASTSAKQPALGTAGTASADVITVQGIASMTALKVDGSAVTQPVSGTVTANAGTGNFTVVQGTGTNLHTVVDSGTVAATQSGTWTVQPGNTANTTPWLATINQGGNSASVSASNALKVDGSAVTQPVSGSVTVSGTVTANIGTSGSLALDATVAETHGTKAAGTAATKSELIGGVYNTSLPSLTNGQQAALQINSTGQLITAAPVNTTGSGSAAAATVSTVATLTAPANTAGFILMNLDTSTANVRWAIGRTASTTLGQQLQPGRDTGFVPSGANVSVCAESGTQNIDIQWVSQ